MLFLEEVLPGRKIRDITYTNTVNTNHDSALHDSVFDVECVDADTGERFTAELQLDDQEFFYDRALFYASLMIEKQLPKGMAAYEYPPVYVISLQNFRTHIPGTAKCPSLRHGRDIHNGENMLYPCPYGYI